MQCVLRIRRFVRLLCEFLRGFQRVPVGVPRSGREMIFGVVMVIFVCWRQWSKMDESLAVSSPRVVVCSHFC